MKGFSDENQLYYAPAVVLIVSVIVFILPFSLNKLSFSGTLFIAGEMWRLFTFPFVHLGFSHLIENIGALAITSILARLVEIKDTEFMIVFMGSGILLAVADIIFFPAIIIAGASLGIYAVLGSITFKGTSFIPKPVLASVLLSSIFFKYLISMISGSLTQNITNQTGMHFFGFMSGILIFYILEKNKSLKKVFTAI